MFRKKNWQNKIDKISTIISSWGKRILTLFGKKEIIYALIISKLQYNATVIPSPPLKSIQEKNKLIFNFLWSKKDHIKRKTLI